jgi:aryl-alcohol dehydrogenase-like predicted oxidoreductase
VIERGFRGIDTANQRRHYDEAAVGRAISAAISKGVVVREDLFLQTKFTFWRGQDRRLPYDPKAAIPVQVERSFASSLAHLGVEQIDGWQLADEVWVHEQGFSRRDGEVFETRDVFEAWLRWPVLVV